ncbi:hypothetical protein NDU88_000763 [Pleurodeles waltl]|uniref:Uncharacterized protein n=1 Tax=Pleurodeles waltl TaxID=8319 RepID=A0AAV7V7T6_PLEWA|nr:hypothetical protein NDU88_000763 [Pleurodeles waltl]
MLTAQGIHRPLLHTVPRSLQGFHASLRTMLGFLQLLRGPRTLVSTKSGSLRLLCGPTRCSTRSQASWPRAKLRAAPRGEAGFKGTRGASDRTVCGGAVDGSPFSPRTDHTPWPHPVTAPGVYKFEVGGVWGGLGIGCLQGRIGKEGHWPVVDGPE